MDSKSQRDAPPPPNDSTPPPAGYGGHYGYGYGYGYGHGYGAEHRNTAAQRSFQQYLLTLRERIWYIVAVFLAVFLSTLIFTLAHQKVYKSGAMVQILRHDPVVMQVQNVEDNEIRSAEDLNTQVKILESDAILLKVAARITGPALDRLLSPYRTSDGEVPSVLQVLGQHRMIVPQRLSLMIEVDFEHPDPQIAAAVANLIVDEYIGYNEHVRSEGSLKAVEDLKDRADEQRKKVGQMAVNLQAYRETNNLVSLDQRKDINTEKLKALNLYVTGTSQRLADAEVHWKQVQECREKKQDLTELPFIASQPLIVQLTQLAASQKIAIAQLRNHYRDKHPKMVEAVNSLAQIERELTRALDVAAAAVEADHQTALRNHQQARQALADQEEASLKLDRYGVEYLNLERDYEVNVKLLDQILGRMGETSVSGTIESQNARLLDRAAPASKPSIPNVPLNLALGLVGGLGLGVASAFFVAFLDDRVKSAFDIEGIVGLPLLGVIPHMRGEDVTKKATVVVNDADRIVSEAFRGIYASLLLHEESKAAKCLLVTSTLASEGKSFIVTNLALAFATYGGRTLIVDCDLRRPSIHKLLELENKCGVLDVVAGRATAEQAVVHTKYPGLDALLTGGRAQSPTQVINDPKMAALIADLRTRYDRILFDSPPVSGVSDALLLLPLVDGCLFTLRFNKVHRRGARYCLHKVMNTEVPCFGAVLNNLNLNISGYYYSQYYDKSFKDYVTPPKDAKA